MSETAEKRRMTSSPLRNTIRSFWTPETNRDPEFLRLIRIDKAVFLIMVGAAIAALTCITVGAIALLTI